MAHSILVLGLGPAGASISNFLVRLGHQVVAIDRGDFSNDFKIGESLPPDAKTVLQQLDLWQDFNAANYEKCFGNQSYWHSNEASFHDFVQHPVGHGWHIDRVEFERMLLAKAALLEVDIRWRTTITRFERLDNAWQVQLQSKNGSTVDEQFDFIVDATGRQSWFAKQLKVERLFEVEQLALVVFLSLNSPLEDSTSLIETVDGGWWYSAKIPKQRAVSAFIFNPTEQTMPVQASESSWYSKLSQTQHTKARLSNGDLLAKPKIVVADSSILQRNFGEGWLAIGDAAMTYDPLAAHGLMMAMVSARDGAAAIDGVLKGRDDTLPLYGKRMADSFIHYCQVRRTLVGH